MKSKIQKKNFPKSNSLVANFLALLVFSFLVSSSSVWADQFNDQYFLKKGEVLDLTHEVPGAGSYSQGYYQEDEENPSETEEDPTTEEETMPSQNVPPPSNQPPVETEEDAVNALIAQGAIVTVGGDDEFLIGGGTIGGFSVTINGEKVRAAIRGDVDIGDILKFWRGVKNRTSEKSGGGRLSTGQYYALLAAELAGNDAGLESAALSASRFEITYRSRGALFALFPFSFPVRVEVTGAAATSEERVRVRLPWYRFFIRKYFSARSLAAEIDVIVDKELSGLTKGEENVQAILFTAVAEFLKQKTRVISDSIFRGPT